MRKFNSWDFNDSCQGSSFSGAGGYKIESQQLEKKILKGHRQCGNLALPSSPSDLPPRKLQSSLCPGGPSAKQTSFPITGRLFSMQVSVQAQARVLSQAN